MALAARVATFLEARALLRAVETSLVAGEADVRAAFVVALAYEEAHGAVTLALAALPGDADALGDRLALAWQEATGARLPRSDYYVCAIFAETAVIARAGIRAELDAGAVQVRCAAGSA